MRHKLLGDSKFLLPADENRRRSAYRHALGNFKAFLICGLVV